MRWAGNGRQTVPRPTASEHASQTSTALDAGVVAGDRLPGLVEPARIGARRAIHAEAPRSLPIHPDGARNKVGLGGGHARGRCPASRPHTKNHAALAVVSATRRVANVPRGMATPYHSVWSRASRRDVAQ